jgi:glycine hydroxymethyltransferase
MYAKRISEIEGLIRRQDEWRATCINLIASENVLSLRARRLLGSDFHHRYAEGHPGQRYYQGTEFIDPIEERTRQEMKALFRCAQADVRAISGTIANDAVFSVLIPRDAPVYANTVATGGHISHQKLGSLGRYTRNYRNFPMLPDGYRVDVAKLKDEIAKDPPVAVLFGRSLFIHPEPVKEVAEVCREKKIVIIYDGAHVLGLIAGRQFQDPLAEGADVLMGSTHKTYFGPQRGVVLSTLPDAAWKKVDRAVFPGMTSNHHLDTLPPLLVATLEFRAFGEAYAAQVVTNARALAKALVAKGFAVDGAAFGYTHSHQVAVNVGAQGGGKQASETLKTNDIICNMNLLPSEQGRSPLDPGGIRIGVQEMTRIGMKEPEMEAIAGLMHEILVKGRNAKAEVNALKARFPKVLYSYDDVA